MKQTVVVKWFGPYSLESIHEREAASNMGFMLYTDDLGIKKHCFI
jgi:hypothetical protein